MSKLSEGRHRLAAILFVDIVGLNELVQNDREQGEQLARNYTEIQAPRVVEHHGREISHGLTGLERRGLKGWLTGPQAGSGEASQLSESILEFHNCLDAVNCAVAIQRGVRQHNRAVATRKELSVKIGIHLGEVVSTERGVLGESLNVASQLALLAQPGGICVSEHVFDAVSNKSEISTIDLGKRNLKNVEMPIEVYGVVLPWEEKLHVKTTSPTIDRKRIAVLPLVSLSPDPDDEYFADGTTEEVISTLSNVSSLTVISRTSVMQYKGAKKNLADIGRELNAGTLLEGSVRKAGNRVRITVQLIDAAEDRHLWAQSYDRELHDVFAVQSDIAKSVVDALKVKLLANDASQIQKKPTESMDAYLLYLNGRQHWNKRSKAEVTKAIEYFIQAIDHDPNFALAYVGLAESYWLLWNDGVITPAEEAKWRDAASKALELDRTLAEAHAVYAEIIGLLDWDFSAAKIELKKALELNSNYALGHMRYSLELKDEGRLEEALVEAKKALELDPITPMMSGAVGRVLYNLERYDEAIDYYKRTLTFEPNYHPALLMLARIYALKGEFDESMAWWKKYAPLASSRAEATIELALIQAIAGRKGEALNSVASAMKQEGSTKIPPDYLAEVFGALHDEERMFEVLEKAVEDHIFVRWIRGEPLFKEWRSSPRFLRILQKIEAPASNLP